MSSEECDWCVCLVESRVGCVHIMRSGWVHIIWSVVGAGGGGCEVRCYKVKVE